MNDTQALASFAALSNETRLTILKRLVRAGPSGMTAGDVAAAVGASPSRASFHLAAIAETGLITSTRQSRQIIYKANFETLGALMRFFLTDCCADHPDVVSCC